MLVVSLTLNVSVNALGIDLIRALAEQLNGDIEYTQNGDCWVKLYFESID